MEKYFIRVVSLATKNRLQKVVLDEIVNKYHHALVSCDDVNTILDNVRYIVESQNAIYVRCKNLSINIFNKNNIMVNDFITIIITKIEKEHEYR